MSDILTPPPPIQEWAQWGTPEHALLQAIYRARNCFGAGFGNYAWGAKEVIDAVFPRVSQTADLQRAYADFNARYERWKND